MPRSYSRVILHTVFATKYRRPLIDPAMEDGLYGVMGNELRKQGCDVIRINGGFDHVHLVHTLARTVTIAAVLQEVKARSSRWMTNNHPRQMKFAWQEGYGSHSVDYRKLDKLIRYVERQKWHHYGKSRADEIRMTFEQEYSALLTAFGFEFDSAKEFPPSPN